MVYALFQFWYLEPKKSGKPWRRLKLGLKVFFRDFFHPLGTSFSRQLGTAVEQSEFVFQILSIRSGLPDFSWYNVPKRGKIYQIIIKYSEWLQNIQNCRKIDQMAIKYTNIFHCKTLQSLPKLEFLV
jgi:hypothetical protein